MNEVKKTTDFEKSVLKTLHRRRIFAAAAVVALIAVIGLIAFFVWNAVRIPAFIPPVYTLEPESADYWRSRTQADIDETEAELPSVRQVRSRQQRLRHTLAEAQRIESDFRRWTAISDIAITMAVNNVDLNIDATLRDMGESVMAQTIYARILVSQALMYVRLGNPTAARAVIQDYHRIVIDSDLKLDSEINRLGFIGAVNALMSLEEKGQLTEMFNRQVLFSLRVAVGQRPTAYRILAGEQARVGMPLPAIQSTQRIDNPVELVRAYQMIIALTARPVKFEPVEPMFYELKTEGPWDPIPAPTVARRAVDSVLEQIAMNEELEAQVRLLVRLAGSRLMCDPEIHRIFKEAVKASAFDELVKRPAMKLLDEPESDLIRAALGMPPLQRERPLNLDPAQDDWSVPHESVSVDLIEFDPDMVKTLLDMQTIRVRLMTAQSYLMVSRYQDAIAVLRKTVPIVRRISHPADRVEHLLLVAEKQISAGAVLEARETLLAVGLPQTNEDTVRDADSMRRLSDLARLQIVARFFDDALATLARMENGPQRNDDLAMLAAEQIRIRQFDDAEKTVALMAPSPRTDELKHVLALGRGGGSEHYEALKIPDPAGLTRDGDLRRVCELLHRHGLYAIAEKTAERIIDAEIRSGRQRRIAREYMLMFRAYRGEDEFHRGVRKKLLQAACALVDEIKDIRHRAALLESILADAAPLVKDGEQRELLLDLHAEALRACRRIEGAEDEKAERLGKLLLAEIALRTSDRPTGAAWPLILREKQPEIHAAILEHVDEVLAAVNNAEDTLQRGLAISHLAQTLGQIGRARAANQMIEEARETARNIKRSRDAVTVLLSLVPTLRMLDDEKTVENVYSSAFAVTSDSFTDSSPGDEKTYEMFVRDSETDRIVRSLLENGYLDEAVKYTVRIEADVPRERLFRTAAYIYLDQGETLLAEAMVRKIKLPDIATEALRDVVFVKRQLTRSGSGTTYESEIAPPEK